MTTNGSSRRRSSVETDALALPLANGLVPVRSPASASIGGYVRLTSHVLLQAERKPFRTIGVVSAHDGEGKTTTAMNLAACLGRTRGRLGRVLLVDADMRSRTLSRLLGAETTGDGGSAGSSRRTPRLSLTDFEGVDLMAAPENGDEITLFGPGMWAQVLAALAPRYSMVVVDCPSVLDCAEGLVLPAVVDRLVLVVQAGRTKRGSVTAAIEAVDRKPVGVVLNQMDRR
jgi:Mrp family chromosome partitioning ATPase